LHAARIPASCHAELSSWPRSIATKAWRVADKGRHGSMTTMTTFVDDEGRERSPSAATSQRESWPNPITDIREDMQTYVHLEIHNYIIKLFD
jgi:hypothetical protein